jgi:hypothetical protein
MRKPNSSSVWLLLMSMIVVGVILPVQSQTVGLTSTSVAMEGDLPSKGSIPKLYDEMDLQQATQAYLWALPLVSFAQW